MNVTQTGNVGHPGIMPPTNDQLVSTYRSITESAMRNGTIEELEGPPVDNPNKWPSYNITPEGLQDVHRQVFNIQGTLYLQTSSPWGPGGQPFSSWGKVGPAPVF